MTTNYPNTVVGLRMTAPLDLLTAENSRKGYSLDSVAADQKYQRKVFEEKSDWEDLSKKYTEAVRRLGLYTELETAQKRKFQNERERQSRGKSTAYLVLQFEQDLANSQVARIRAEFEVATLLTQMKLYQ